jgi:hypothetical protein
MGLKSKINETKKKSEEKKKKLREENETIDKKNLEKR